MLPNSQTLINAFPPSASVLKTFVLGKKHLTKSPSTKGRRGSPRSHISRKGVISRDGRNVIIPPLWEIKGLPVNQNFFLLLIRSQSRTLGLLQREGNFPLGLDYSRAPCLISEGCRVFKECWQGRGRGGPLQGRRCPALMNQSSWRPTAIWLLSFHPAKKNRYKPAPSLGILVRDEKGSKASKEQGGKRGSSLSAKGNKHSQHQHEFWWVRRGSGISSYIPIPIRSTPPKFPLSHGSSHERAT